MNGSNVIRLLIDPDTEAAEDLIAQATESIEDSLRVTIDVRTRHTLSQALVHLHEAQLLLS